MPEFLRLLPPDEARSLLLSHLPGPKANSELIDTIHALDRVAAEDVVAPHPLPEFPRSTVDGYAVRARDTFGASDSLPAYLNLIGEVPMGNAPAFDLQPGQCALIHTGGMLPNNADAVVMLEYTQNTVGAERRSAPTNIEIEIMRTVAEGENVIRVGEDVIAGQTIIPRGVRLRAAEIGGLMALGITQLRVANKTRIGLISSGDEVIAPGQSPRPGQVRDVNAYTLSSLVTKTGGEVVLYGIVRDQFDALQKTAARALSECDVVVITAGSSASTRDMTADVINSMGAPGVLVHGVNTRPGKPTILGVCDGKAVIGLPGNPVSALVNGHLFLVPVIEKLLGEIPRPRPTVTARLTVNLPSQAGREDWIAVRLIPIPLSLDPSLRAEWGEGGRETWQAEPIFGKSNLIFTLAAADGLLRIPPDATGLSAGEMVDVLLI
ncbi:MAG: molybdopterin molybdotransferase MoeA [Chloroflexi bacterium]|nr:molybdopterin molybdotransferase MoeA [Chloroflexota bacterium]